MGRFASVRDGLKSSPYYYLVLLLFANFMFGALGVVTRTLSTEYEMSMESITFFRQLYSTLIMGGAILIISRKSFRFAKNTFFLLLFMGIVKAMSDFFLFYAFKTIPIGLATLLQMTAPFFAVIVLFFFFRENIVLRSVMALAFGTFGCILCTFSIVGEIGINGIIYGLLSGFTCAVYVILGNISGKKGNKPSTTLFYTSLFGTILFFPPVCTEFTDFPSLFDKIEPIGLIFVMAAFMTLLPFYIVFYTVTRLGPAKTTMINMSEFVFSSIFGYLFYHDLIYPPEAAGMIMIVLAVFTMNVDLSKKSPKMQAILEKVVVNASVLVSKRKRAAGR